MGLNCHCFLLITQKAALFSGYASKFFSSQLVGSILLFLLLKPDEDTSVSCELSHHSCTREVLSPRPEEIGSERPALCAW